MTADRRSEFNTATDGFASDFPPVFVEPIEFPQDSSGGSANVKAQRSPSASGRAPCARTACCIRASKVAPAEHAVDVVAHVLFEIAGSRRLSLPDLPSPYAGAVYLGHRILENPSDLRSHVQRILLLIEKGDELDLQGALVDLFIALGDKGRALKVRLLNLAAPRLPLGVKAFLTQRLATGIKPWELAVSRMRTSLLSLGFSGVYEVVRRRDRRSSSTYVNAVEEARACLEYGQVDAARDVLEKALLLEPGNGAVAAELLEIYRYTRDDKRRATTRQFLLAVLPELPATWQEKSSAIPRGPYAFRSGASPHHAGVR